MRGAQDRCACTKALRAIALLLHCVQVSKTQKGSPHSVPEPLCFSEAFVQVRIGYGLTVCFLVLATVSSGGDNVWQHAPLKK